MGSPINPNMRAASSPRPRWTRAEETMVTPQAKTVICKICGWSKHTESITMDGGSHRVRDICRGHRKTTGHQEFQVTDARAKRRRRIAPPPAENLEEKAPNAAEGV